MTGETSQNANILRWLKRGKAITPLEALDRFGSFRLGARIYDLRRKGHHIDRQWVVTDDGKRYAKYRMAG